MGEARRRAAAFAADLDFKEQRRAQVALAATELATNVVKHGGGGSLFINRISCGDQQGVELIAVDRGKGMNFDRCREDGYSTAGTAGTGLGAIVRAADDFQVFSRPGHGTIASASFWPHFASMVAGEPLEVSTLCVPHPGETVVGDSWALQREAARVRVLVADGLGHGLLAHAAAQATVKAFAEGPHLSVTDLFQRMHQALRPTRGAAVAVSEIDLRAGKISFTGIGNVAAVVLKTDGATQSMVSMNGVVGHEFRRIQTFAYPWIPGSTLVMHSDGIGSSWRGADVTELLMRPVNLLSALLFRDFDRGRDDATVLSIRPKAGGNL